MGDDKKTKGKDGEDQKSIVARQEMRTQMVESKQSSMLYCVSPSAAALCRIDGPPRTIMATNKRVFCAVETGNLKVDVLNSKSSTNSSLHQRNHYCSAGCRLLKIDIEQLCAPYTE